MREAERVMFYQRLSKCRGESFFEWDLETDCFTLAKDSSLTIPEENMLIKSGVYENYSKFIIETELLHPDDIKVFDKILLSFYQNHSEIELNDFGEDYREMEFRIKLVDETYMWVKTSFLVIYNESGIAYQIIGLVKNIDNVKRKQVLLERQAKLDLLTSLYNKATSQQLIEQYLKEQQGKTNNALMMIDIDGFKLINDSFGHLFGDVVIADCAMCLKNNFRDTDILGRFGGDEFILLIKDVHSKEFVLERCEQLLEDIRREYISDQYACNISTSIGVAFYPEDGVDFETLFKNADFALYKAKELGKDNYVCYSSELNSYGYQNDRIEGNNRLEAAPENNADNIAPMAFKDNILKYIIRLLSQDISKNLTVNMILESVGKSFELDRIFISQGNSLKNAGILFEWNKNKIVNAVNDKLNEKLEELAADTSYGRNILYDYSVKVDKELAEILRESNISVMLCHTVVSNGAIKGYAGFEIFKERRQLSNEEYENLCLIADLLAIYLLKL